LRRGRRKGRGKVDFCEAHRTPPEASLTVHPPTPEKKKDRRISPCHHAMIRLYSHTQKEKKKTITNKREADNKQVCNSGVRDTRFLSKMQTAFGVLHRGKKKIYI
jgi:hypothetical protein